MTSFLSMEADLDILADVLENRAKRMREDAMHQCTTDEMRGYWQGRAEGLETAAAMIRSTLEGHQPLPEDFGETP